MKTDLKKFISQSLIQLNVNSIYGGANELDGCMTLGGCSDDEYNFTEQWTDDEGGHETSYKSDKMW